MRAAGRRTRCPSCLDFQISRKLTMLTMRAKTARLRDRHTQRVVRFDWIAFAAIPDPAAPSQHCQLSYEPKFGLTGKDVYLIGIAGGRSLSSKASFRIRVSRACLSGIHAL